MPTMDVFNSDAFSATSMTAAVDKLGFVPGLLGSIDGLFVPAPVRTEAVWIEERENSPALIQTDYRGDPVRAKAGDKRSARAFRTRRIAEKSRIQASELQNIRAFGFETELQSVQMEVARRQIILRRDIELTKENLRLGCVQGLVADADGATIYDWATEFGQTIPAELAFDLTAASPASGAVRRQCAAVVRSIQRGLRGLGGDAVNVVGLCGDAFFDDLIANVEVRATYLNQQEASDLRTGSAFQRLNYGGILFINYRSTDDASTVLINTDKCKFFPTNAGIFQWAMSPGETFEFVNTLGMDLYSWVEMDPAQNKKWADVEMYSYPLPVCTMPQALHRAKRGA